VTVTDLLILAAHIEDLLDLVKERLDEIDHALEATR
jgi:hypothetical protein